MSHPSFTPIPLFRTDPIDPKTAIPEAQWTEADHIAIQTMHTLYEEIDGFRAGYDRSLQQAIGPSEIGMECDVCFMRKMAELPKNPGDDGSWKTQVGTYVHAGLEQDFDRHFGHLGTRIAEGELVIDEYKGRVLRGHCDMFVPNLPEPSDFDDYNGTPTNHEYLEAKKNAFGVVVDWKIPSTDEDAAGKLKPSSTMQKVVAGKVGQQYLAQSMAYGRGWVRRGFNVTHVAVFYIPSFGQLWHARPILMRYSPEWAAWGIQRWRAALDARDVFMSMGATEEQAWDHLIKQQKKANFCFSCKGYEELEQTAGGLALLRGK